MAVQDLERIEQKIDRAVAGGVAVSDNIGGVLFENMAQVMEFAKLLAVSGTAVPRHLRGNPGGCLAVTIQALEWRMSPIAVANKSYEVNDRIAYESQLIHAVVEARAPLKQRLRCKFEGEGDALVCVVTGHFEKEADPVEYRSPPIAKIKIKNSPLWAADPQQQLWYYSVRAFARRYCPDVLMGIYAEDELQDTGPENARDITPRPEIGKRLAGQKGRGFDKAYVEGEIAAATKPDAPKISPDVTDAQIALPPDVETELADKARALDSIEDEAALKAAVEQTTAWLKEKGRTDLLASFLSAAKTREKKIKKAPA